MQCLKDLMEKNISLSEKMTNILTQAEHSLVNLENCAKPICCESESLQNKLRNSESLLNLIEAITLHKQTINHVQSVILSSDIDSFEDFTYLLSDLKRAKAFFQEKFSGCVFISQCNSLLNDSVKILENEFIRTLSDNCVMQTPFTLFEAVKSAVNTENNEENNRAIFANTEISVESLTEKTIMDLQQIFAWIKEFGGGAYQLECLERYVKLRNEYLVALLTSLISHIKSRSGGSLSQLSKSSSFSADTNHTLDSFSNKSNYSGDRCKAKLGAAVPSLLDCSASTHVLEVELLMRYLLLAYIKLTTKESAYLCSIVGGCSGQTLANIICDALTNIFTSIQSMCAPSLSLYFALYRCLKCFQPIFIAAFVLSASPCHLINAKIGELKDKIKSGLEECVQLIREDTTKVPSDGTVAQVTSNTTLFLEALSSESIKPLVAQVLRSDEIFINESRNDLKILGIYISRVLSTLGLSIRLKFENYSKECLGTIFLINNFSYILKFLLSSQLLSIVALHTPKVREYYEQQICEYRRLYMQTWSRLIALILPDDDSPQLPSRHSATDFTGSFRLRERDKNSIKDKCTSFNKYFEELVSQNRKLTLPDHKLRDTLISEIMAYVLPAYKEFISRYSHLPFSKNPSKYIKYDTENLTLIIQDFFKGKDQ